MNDTNLAEIIAIAGRISKGNSGGGSGSDAVWLPNVDASGDISWQKSSTATPPTTRNIKGASGSDGEDGNGIESATLNADYTLTLRYTDGTSYTTPSIRGAQGIQGNPGLSGRDGVDGHTPVKGTDYWTASDKSEIVSDVLAALPVWDGGAY